MSTTIKDPQQAIFAKIRAVLSDMNIPIYDGVLPPDKTPYPFIFLGRTSQTDEFTKTHIHGTIMQQIDVWSNKLKRGDLSEILLKIKRKCRFLESEDFVFLNISVNQEIMNEKEKDNTNEYILHGVLDLGFRFSLK